MLLLALLVAAPAASAAPVDGRAKDMAATVLAIHSPILIEGDASFTPENGVTSGSGSSADPYVIEGWQIDGGTGSAIEVHNTGAAVTIRDVTILGGLMGIRLQSVSNARLESSNLSASHTDLYAYGGSNLTIFRNLVHGNGDFGIRIDTVEDVLIANNTVRDVPGYGIAVWSAVQERPVRILRNVVTGNGHGISLLGSWGVTVSENSIAGNGIEQGYDSNPTANAWDGGYPAGGNLWSDYAGWDDCSGPAQDVCPDPDGLGDRPYQVTGEAFDRYPILLSSPPNRPPVAAFDVSAGPWFPGTTIVFDASRSLDPDGYPLVYGWSFGDGTFLEGPDAVVHHAYSAVGTWLVTLTVTDVRRAGNSTHAGISVVPQPEPEPLVLRPYEHPRAGFRLPIPEGWGIQEDVRFGNTTVELLLFGPVGGGLQTNILVETDRDATVRETNSYLLGAANTAIADIRRDNPTTSVNVMEGPTLERIAAHDAVTFRLQYGTGESYQSAAIVVSEPHGRYWILILTTDGQSLEVMHDGFRRMLQDFEITLAPDPETSPPVPAQGLSMPMIVLGVLAGVVGGVLVAVLVAMRSRRRTRLPVAPPLPWTPPVVAAPPVLAAWPRFCPACGHALEAGSRFCGRCGSAISPPSASWPPGPPPGS